MKRLLWFFLVLLFCFSVAVLFINGQVPPIPWTEITNKVIPINNNSHEKETTSILINDEDITFSQDSMEIIEREFSWEYGGNKWNYKLQIPQAAYDYYANKERLPLVNTNVFSLYVTEPGHKEFIAKLAETFSNAAKKEGYSLKQILEFVLAFVQSLEYVTDEASKGVDQYTRYPVETLVELQGDCKAKSVLYAALLRQLGIDCVLVVLPGNPGHMAVAVRGEGLPGTYYEFQGAHYYYVETTGYGWKIGWIPEEYQNREAIIVPIKSQPLIIHQWESKVMANGKIEITVTVENLGTESANETKVYAALDAGDDKVYDQIWASPLDLSPGSKGVYTVNLKAPANIETRILVKIISNNYLMDESASEWFVPYKN